MNDIKDKNINDLNSEKAQAFDNVIIDNILIALNNQTDMLSVLNEKIDSILKIVSLDKQVKNLNKHTQKRGRKKLKIYYDDKEIADEDLIYLIDVQGNSVTDILPFFYMIDNGKKIAGNSLIAKERERCYKTIYNRLTQYRKENYKED